MSVDAVIEDDDVPHAVIHLYGDMGKYVAEADESGDAEFEEIRAGNYGWEVTHGGRHLVPEKDTSPTIEVVAGSCGSATFELVAPE